MKNNQGFTLVGLMIIAAMLSVIAVTGVTIMKNNANKADIDKRTAQGNQLISNVANGSGGSTLQASGDLQFQPLATPDPNDPNNPNNPESPLNPNNVNNPNNDGSPLNPNSPANPSNPNHTAAGCSAPCHVSTNPNTGNAQCMLTDTDCACLGNCPIPPQGCTYVAEGPGDPKYQPVDEGGQGQACPSTPNCSNPYVACPRHHVCHCPGDISDCGSSAPCPPGQVHLLPWGACGPANSGTPMDQNLNQAN